MRPDQLINPFELKALKDRLAEAEETLTAIRTGAVDAVIVNGEYGPQVFTLQSADHPYRIMIEAMNEGAVTLTSDGCIVYCNRRFSDMVLVGATELLGRPFSNFLLEKDVPTFINLLPQALTRSLRVELQIRTNGERTLPVVISLSPLPGVETKAVCAIFTDISDQKARAQAEANEQKYRELAKELERAQLKLNDKINDLEMFYDVAVSRELRMIELEKQLHTLQQHVPPANGSVDNLV